MRRTVFDRYGGFTTISRIVSAFYDRVLDSPVTSPYFEGIDMRRLVDHQTRFIATVMGGPASYTNEQLERAHARLGITDAAFQEAVALLRETLEDFDLSAEDAQAVLREVTTRKHVIVTRA
jgi:hemoglobin